MTSADSVVAGEPGARVALAAAVGAGPVFPGDVPGEGVARDFSKSEQARRGPRWRRNLVFGWFQLGYWLGIGLMFFPYVAAMPQAAPSPVYLVLNRMLVGAAATTVVHIFYVTWLRGLGRAVRWSALAVSTVVALGSTRFFFTSLYRGAPLARAMVAILWYLLYVALEIAQNQFETLVRASQAEARAAEAEAAARASELQRLESQLNPHFLFNALNAVAASSGDAEAVVRVTQDLADYLRLALRKSRPLEPLAEEIASLEKYLSVQQARFGDDLVCEIECDRESQTVLVPPMTIQPLLENAFEYGGRTSPRPLVVRVTCRVEQDWLVITVTNTGSWVAPGHGRSNSIGLENLRKRLTLLLGDRTSVGVEAEDGQVRLVVRVPATRRRSRSNAHA